MCFNLINNSECWKRLSQRCSKVFCPGFYRDYQFPSEKTSSFFSLMIIDFYSKLVCPCYDWPSLLNLANNLCKSNRVKHLFDRYWHFFHRKDPSSIIWRELSIKKITWEYFLHLLRAKLIGLGIDLPQFHYNFSI